MFLPVRRGVFDSPIKTSKPHVPFFGPHGFISHGCVVFQDWLKGTVTVEILSNLVFLF